MSPSPIPTVLSTLRNRRVKALLMGGQACILYGAAEFSRDVDIAVSVDPENLSRLRAALDRLKAESVFFPPLSSDALQRGHACHFRCHAPGLGGVRLDVMSVMRGAAPFGELWKRRTRLRLPGVGEVSVVSLRDLVRIKKTQRGKDWPMIQRLVEADIARPGAVTAPRIRFWLKECRTTDRILDLVARYPQLARGESDRPAVRHALTGSRTRVQEALSSEQRREMAQDRKYWKPLRAELERWRSARSRGI